MAERMTRTEAAAVQVLVINYHLFHKHFERGEVRKPVDAARNVRKVAHIARRAGVSVADIVAIANKADAARFV